MSFASLLYDSKNWVCQERYKIVGEEAKLYISNRVNETQVIKLSVMKLKKKNAGRYILERCMGIGVLC